LDKPTCLAAPSFSAFIAFTASATVAACVFQIV
jgi:hypothetical protein